MVRRLAMILAGAAAFAPPVLAQSFEEAVEQAQTAGPGMFREPGVFISEMASLSRSWTVNAIYGDWTGEGEQRSRRWIVRRAVGDRTGQTALVWADSRTCPTVREVLIAMENMAPPRPQVYGLRAEPEQIVVVADGAQVVFRSRWSQAGSEGALVQFQVQGNVNAPHAIWWEESVQALADCWTPEAPE